MTSNNNTIMMRMMTRVLPSCKEVSHLSSQAMDEQLPISKKVGLRLHLYFCSLCRESVRQLHLMRRIARDRVAKESTGDKLSAEARRRINDFIDGAE